MKKNHIYKGDCIDVMTRKLDASSVNLIFADPPYNLSGKGLKWTGNQTGGDWHMVNEKWDTMAADDYWKFTKDWVAACKNVLVGNGSLYVSCTHHNIGEVIIAMKSADFKIKNIITWYKTNAMPNMTRRVLTHASEFVVWAVKGEKWVFNYDDLRRQNPEKQKDGSDKQLRDVWPLPAELQNSQGGAVIGLPVVQGKERLRDKSGRSLHPTQKPEDLVLRIIAASSKNGDTVLDPFMGSGTTAVAAKKLGREWIGIDTDEKYIEAALKRIAGVKDKISEYAL